MVWIRGHDRGRGQGNLRRWNALFAGIFISATSGYSGEIAYDADVSSMVKDFTGGDFPQYVEHACNVLSRVKVKDAKHFATIEEVQFHRNENGGLTVAVVVYDFDLAATDCVELEFARKELADEARREEHLRVMEKCIAGRIVTGSRRQARFWIKAGLSFLAVFFLALVIAYLFSDTLGLELWKSRKDRTSTAAQKEKNLSVRRRKLLRKAGQGKRH
jgi:hypothetical protein